MHQEVEAAPLCLQMGEHRIQLFVASTSAGSTMVEPTPAASGPSRFFWASP